VVLGSTPKLGMAGMMFFYALVLLVQHYFCLAASNRRKQKGADSYLEEHIFYEENSPEHSWKDFAVFENYAPLSVKPSPSSSSRRGRSGSNNRHSSINSCEFEDEEYDFDQQHLDQHFEYPPPNRERYSNNKRISIDKRRFIDEDEEEIEIDNTNKEGHSSVSEKANRSLPSFDELYAQLRNNDFNNLASN
jgi:hypothetical protein